MRALLAEPGICARIPGRVIFRLLKPFRVAAIRGRPNRGRAARRRGGGIPYGSRIPDYQHIREDAGKQSLGRMYPTTQIDSR